MSRSEMLDKIAELFGSWPEAVSQAVAVGMALGRIEAEQEKEKEET